MSKVIASLTANIGANVDGFLAGAGKVKGVMGNLAGALSGVTIVAALTAVGNALKGTIDSTLKYDDEVRRLAQITGTGAEASSRMLQVLDDLKISSDDLTKATRKMTQEGLSPTLETLADLSDEYRKLAPGQKQAAFLMDNFGRSGLRFAEAMGKGGDALKKMGGEVEKSLIRTDAQIKLSRLAEMRLDNWQDAVHGIAIAIGTELIGALDGSSFAIENQTRAAYYAATGTYYNTTSVWANTEAQTALWEQLKLQETQTYLTANGMDTLASSIEAEAAISAEAEKASGTLVSTIFSQKDATEQYDSAILSLNQQLKDGTIDQKEFETGVASAAAAHEAAANKIIFNLVQMALAADGWQAGDTAALLSAGVSLGQFDQKQADTAQLTIDSATAMADAHADFATSLGETTPSAIGSLDNLDKMLNTGKITVAQYKSYVHELIGQIGRLDGMTATATINLIVNGGIPNLGNVVVGGGGGQGSGTGSGGSSKTRADGGSFGANSIFSIAERGNPEMITAGGKSWIVSGSHGGNVTPMDKAGGMAGGLGGDISSSSLRELAKMLSSEMAKAIQ